MAHQRRGRTNSHLVEEGIHGPSGGGLSEEDSASGSSDDEHAGDDGQFAALYASAYAGAYADAYAEALAAGLARREAQAHSKEDEMPRRASLTTARPSWRRRRYVVGTVVLWWVCVVVATVWMYRVLVHPCEYGHRGAWAIGLVAFKDAGFGPIQHAAELLNCQHTRGYTSVRRPMLVADSRQMYLFYELENAQGLRSVGLSTRPRAEGHNGTTLADSALGWRFWGPVLQESQSVGAPYVFEHEKQWYMVPQREAGRLRLYVAVDFPQQWKVARELVTGKGTPGYSQLLPYKGRWYLLTSWGGNAHVYVSDTDDLLTSALELHPFSPVNRDKHRFVHLAGPVQPHPSQPGHFLRPVHDSGWLSGDRTAKWLEIDYLDHWDYREIDAGWLQPNSSASWMARRVDHVQLLSPSLAASLGASPVAALVGGGSFLFSGTLEFYLMLFPLLLLALVGSIIIFLFFSFSLKYPI